MITPDELSAACNKRIQLRHLARAERCLQIRHTVVAAECNLLIVPRFIRPACHTGRITRNAVTAIELQCVAKLLPIRQNHPALPRRDDLHRMKAEHGHIRIRAGADLIVLIRAADGMRSILDHGETILPRQLPNALHRTGLSCKMNRNNNLRQLLCRLEFLLKCRDTHIIGLIVDIDKVHVCTAVAGTVRRRDEGDGACPEHIPFPQPCRLTGDMQCRCRIRYRHGVRRTTISRHRSFKTLNRRPLCQKIGGQNLPYRLDILICDMLMSVVDHTAPQYAFSSSRRSSTDSHSVFCPESYSKPSGTGLPVMWRRSLSSLFHQ